MNWFEDLFYFENGFQLDRDYQECQTIHESHETTSFLIETKLPIDKTKWFFNKRKGTHNFRFGKTTSWISDNARRSILKNGATVTTYQQEASGYPTKIEILYYTNGIGVFPYWKYDPRPYSTKIYFTKYGIMDSATIGFKTKDGGSRNTTFKPTKVSNVNPLLTNFYKDDIVKLEMLHAMYDFNVGRLIRIVNANELV